MNNAIILIPENPSKNATQVITNGVNKITILNILKTLMGGLSKELVKEAEAAVGKDPKAQEKYLDQLIKQANKEEDGESQVNFN